MEPLFSPGGQEQVYSLRKRLIRSAYERRDVWHTREEALQHLKSGTRWDPRVQELFVVGSPENWAVESPTYELDRNTHLNSTQDHLSIHHIMGSHLLAPVMKRRSVSAYLAGIDVINLTPFGTGYV